MIDLFIDRSKFGSAKVQIFFNQQRGIEKKLNRAKSFSDLEVNSSATLSK
jgi:hypothetical protein